MFDKAHYCCQEADSLCSQSSWHTFATNTDITKYLCYLYQSAALNESIIYLPLLLLLLLLLLLKLYFTPLIAVSGFFFSFLWTPYRNNDTVGGPSLTYSQKSARAYSQDNRQRTMDRIKRSLKRRNTQSVHIVE